jgi:hypothetical protein
VRWSEVKCREVNCGWMKGRPNCRVINSLKFCLPPCIYQARWILRRTQEPSSNSGRDID